MNKAESSFGASGASLQERMAAYRAGQLTWPALQGQGRCSACTHYEPGKKGKGVCALVQAHTKKPSKPFEGERAHGCCKWELMP